MITSKSIFLEFIFEISKDFDQLFEVLILTDNEIFFSSNKDSNYYYSIIWYNSNYDLLDRIAQKKIGKILKI